jgi:hypothetical protein
VQKIAHDYAAMAQIGTQIRNAGSATTPRTSARRQLVTGELDMKRVGDEDIRTLRGENDRTVINSIEAEQ